MITTIRKLLTFLFLLQASVCFASTDTSGIPKENALFNRRVDEAQNDADMLDHKKDGQIHITNNEEVNLQIADALFRQVDEIQLAIEKDKRLRSKNDQVRCLRYLKDMVLAFNTAYHNRQINPANAPLLVDNFRKVLNANLDSLSMVPFIEEVPYEVGLICSEIFKDNKGYYESKRILFLEYSALHPDKILQIIGPYAHESFADSLIVMACKNNPAEFYKYAQDIASPVGKLIHRNQDAMVKVVAGLSEMPSALFYFPFLDDILSGKKSTDSLRGLIGNGEIGYDSVGYFKLLVKTEIEYSNRLLSKDTPIAMFGPNGLRDVLQRKAIEHFINPINALHEAPENTRMRAVEPLSSIDLYYVMVMGENDIYTSSYKHSFTRFLQRLGKRPRTDSLLMNVNFDYFKKFIKMAANFNRLDTFLSLMPPERASATMKGFVSNLDKTKNLEDAVDVADAFSSINNKKLLNSMLRYVEENEQKSINESNNKGRVIYGLLKTIFLSADSTNKIDLTSTIGIPSIYSIEQKDLVDDSGRIIQQVFFYGDADGKSYFNGFINSFDRKIWRVNMLPKEWVEIKTMKGPKIWIYANKPLNSDKNLDDTAQVHLNKYLDKNNLAPVVVVHRGHSYWLDGTIKRMPGDSKIMILGSCGGYKNLSKILAISPDVQIISTKEIGKGDINTPVLTYLNQNLLTGKTLSWPGIWATLTRLFSKEPNKEVKESWEAYVPPYKNLGAIFIKAYNKKMEGSE